MKLKNNRKIFKKLNVQEPLKDRHIIILIDYLYNHVNTESEAIKHLAKFIFKKYHNEKLSLTSLKKWCRDFIPTKCAHNEKYWTSRGWSLEESKEKTKELGKLQTNKSRQTIIKRLMLEHNIDIEQAKALCREQNTKRLIGQYSIRDKSYRREKSVRCVEYWLKRGYTDKEAIIKVKEQQSKNGKKQKKRPLHKRNTRIEFYLNLGMSFEAAELALQKRQATKGPWKNPSLYTRYRRQVERHTNYWIKRGMVENSNVRGQDWHIDHIFSCSHGFLKKVPPEIIGHYSNLRIITSIENRNKYYKSHKSYEQLIEDFNNGEKYKDD